MPVPPLDPPPDPLALFKEWRADAEACDTIQYAGAMCLSTVAPDGFPEGRIVLLHDSGPDGFAFFTDRRSAKGQSLAETPRAALTFYWGPLERQVRVQGPVEPGTPTEADAFFDERPRRSKGTAWAAPQSQPVTRSDLERRVREVDARFEEHASIPRPPDWQVYRVRPRSIEFWEARARRLHERVRCTRGEGERWTWERLVP
ncbi:MAG: pyridoxamine 5'-phosphate oxidase [Salinivenus sp.]